MRKVFCDICGKEIKPDNETWRQRLQANERNVKISFNESLDEICEGCATKIHYCVSMMMKKHEWKPDFHELNEKREILQNRK